MIREVLVRRVLFAAAVACTCLACAVERTEAAETEILGTVAQQLAAQATCNPASPETCCVSGSSIVRLTDGDDTFSNAISGRCILALGGRDVEPVHSLFPKCRWAPSRSWPA